MITESIPGNFECPVYLQNYILKVDSELNPCFFYFEADKGTAKVILTLLREYPLSASLLFQIELVCGDVSTLQIKEDGVKHAETERRIRDGAPSEIWKT